MRMSECHPERPYQARGMCENCYQTWYTANKRKKKDRKDPSEYAPNFRKPPFKPKRNADCHPDRPHVGLGLCGSCYQRDRPEVPRATCHPEKRLVADGLCNACYKQRQYRADPEKFQQQARESQAKVRKRLREQLIEEYGGRCACANCPETNPAFLTLEHVNGDGKKHRAEVGSHSYADLRRRGFPREGYTLLCWNCNALTRFGRTCPHEEN